MPTYDFRCPKGHEFSRFYKTISGAQLTLPCPECNAVAERQISGGAGLAFKGSGFYLTDYGKNAHRTSDVGRRTSESASKSESKSESKPAGDAGSTAATPAAKPAGEAPKPKSEVRRPKSE